MHRLAAILRTDIVGSTETSTGLGPEYRAFRNEHKRRVRSIINDYDPRPQLTGDGFVAVIDTASAAIECASRIQQQLAQQNRRAGTDDLRSIKVRITIDIGELDIDAYDDPMAPAFVVTERLERAAGAGEIVCTDIVRVLARPYTGSNRFRNRRSVEGKGLDEPLVVWHVDWETSVPDPLNLEIPLGAIDEPSKLVGREYEMSELFGWLETASASRDLRHLVVVDGPPGIGKSALVRQFVREVAAQQTALSLTGHCESPTRVPFGPFTEMIRTFARYATPYPELLGADPGQFAQLLPRELCDVLGLSTEDGERHDEDRRLQLFEAFASWLSANAHHRPLVVVIEDLHHADQATLALLDHLLRSELPGRYLFVATHRSTESDWSAPFTNGLEALRKRADAEITVPGLGQRHIIDLLGDHLALETGELDARTASELERYTRGNPLFLRSLIAHGAGLRNLNRRHPERLEVDVPTEVETLTDERLRALSPAARRVMAVAALSGMRFDPDLLQSVVGLSDDEVADSLGEARRFGLVESSADGNLAFTHEILRDAIRAHAEGLPGVADVHVALGRALLAGTPSLEQLASASIHLAAGRDEATVLQAIELSKEVARRGRSRLAPQISAEAIERELELYEALPRDRRPSEGEVLRRRYAFGQALRHAGDPRFIDVLRSVCTDARDLGDPLLMANAALGSLRNNWDETGKVVTDTVNTLRSALDTVAAHAERADGMQRGELLAAQARLSGALAVELSFDPDRVSRESYARDAIATARMLVAEQTEPAGARLAADALARTLERQHGVFTHPGGLLEREKIIGELSVLEAELRDPARSFAAASHSYWTRMELGETNAAEASLTTMRRLSAASSHPRQRAIWLHWQSLHAAYQGRLPRAIELADEARAIKTSIGDDDADVLWIGLMYIPCLHRGTLPQLLDTMKSCVGRTVGLVAIKNGIALALARSSAPGSDEAARIAVEELSIDDEFGHVAHNDLLVSYALLTLTCQELGDAPRAARIRDRLREYQFLADGRPRYIFNGTAMFGSVSHFLAIAHATLGEWDEADRCFQLALEHNRRSRDSPPAEQVDEQRVAAPALVAETQCGWAEMLTARGDPADLPRAQKLAGESFATAERLGLRAVQERADLIR